MRRAPPPTSLAAGWKREHSMEAPHAVALRPRSAAQHNRAGGPTVLSSPAAGQRKKRARPAIGGWWGAVSGLAQRLAFVLALRVGDWPQHPPWGGRSLRFPPRPGGAVHEND
jgi:hypothetical protein